MQDEIGGIKISDIDAKPIKVPGYATRDNVRDRDRGSGRGSVIPLPCTIL